MHKDGAAQALNCNEKTWVLFASLQLKKLHALREKGEVFISFYALIQRQLTDALSRCQVLFQY